jgi:hypothetical protein
MGFRQFGSELGEREAMKELSSLQFQDWGEGVLYAH